MNDKSRILLVSALALVSMAVSVAAQSSPMACEVQVTEPQPGQQVGRAVKVEGTAELSSDHHLWVFARHESFRSLGVWWPQREGVVNADTGEWKVVAAIGQEQDIGDEFDVAAAVFATNEHLLLRQYIRDAMQRGDYQPIDIPPVACPATLLVVRKVGH